MSFFSFTLPFVFTLQIHDFLVTANLQCVGDDIMFTVKGREFIRYSKRLKDFSVNTLKSMTLPLNKTHTHTHTHTDEMKLMIT